MGQNTAWRFRVRVRKPDGWHAIGSVVGWHWSSYQNGDCTIAAHTIGTCLAYSPPDTGCHRYSVVAVNPVAASLAAQFTPSGKGISRTGLCTL